MGNTTTFWTNVSGSVKLDPEALHKFLLERGFYTFRTYEEEKIFIEVRNKVIHRVSHEYIREHCWKYINSEYEFKDPDERRQVKDVFYRNQSILNKANIVLLEGIELNDLKDTEDTSYLFFKNCIVKVTPDSAIKYGYDEIEGYVWQDDIIEFDLNEDIPKEIKTEGEFYEFFLDITKHSINSVEAQNRDSLVTIIGYLLHRLKIPSRAKAVVLMDSFKDGNPQGGTGKGLFSQAFGKVRPTVYQDGKFFKRSDKFAMSNVKYGTRILTIDDVPEDFEFVRIFPLITDRTVVERKYENKIVIPFEDSPKVVLTTNYTIPGKGNSHARRKVEFILSDTYGASYCPEDKFGHLMYLDWTDEEWVKFYSFMIHCLQMYLLMGIVEPKFNVGERILKMNASEEFIGFVNSEVDLGDKYNKRELYETFIAKFPNHPTMEQNTFTRWLKLFADAYGMDVTESHSGEDNFIELTS